MSDDEEHAAKRGPEPGTDRLGRWVAGRARRREYWIWLLPTLAVDGALEFTTLPQIVRALAGLPLLLAMIRRLHDLGISGWVALLINVGSNLLALFLRSTLGAETGGLVGSLVHLAALVTLGLIPGQQRTNGFGPPPGRKQADLAETFS
ncbi:DUF805 domain-containing protein [Phenylobacterium sp.]|uniref:DUF805 domain-containing protein n=1 Tax=Phenylobacterium sp. TaxID=1871053 RepID=UPI0025EE622D|nr:DUF805 domain-containing protein [Phenylobacterium sp.]MBX3484292.1 DUF805 domain-containing protein [Phenylobacterium sp.]MCW5758803.1 DUF805 domain-containing protein [Phenylobacterium sp.]